MIIESPELVELSDFDTKPPKQIYKRQYVDNKKLSAALIDWLTTDKDARMPEYIGECIVKIAQNIGKSHKSRNYTYNDDMVGEAILNAVKYIKNFSKSVETREGKPNGFGYISMMCENIFKQTIKREKKEQYKKYASMCNIAVEELLDDHENNGYNVESIYASMAEKAYDYEEKNNLFKKARKKPAKAVPEFTLDDLL